MIIKKLYISTLQIVTDRVFNYIIESFKLNGRLQWNISISNWNLYFTDQERHDTSVITSHIPYNHLILIFTYKIQFSHTSEAIPRQFRVLFRGPSAGTTSTLHPGCPENRIRPVAVSADHVHIHPHTPHITPSDKSGKHSPRVRRRAVLAVGTRLLCSADVVVSAEAACSQLSNSVYNCQIGFDFSNGLGTHVRIRSAFLVGGASLHFVFEFFLYVYRWFRIRSEWREFRTDSIVMDGNTVRSYFVWR